MVLPKKRSANQSRRCLVECLEPRRVLDGSLVITELMARNDNSIVDENGDHSDWIEIFNPTESDVSLTGWKLTDRFDDLTKWSFPDRSISSNEFLIVFASGKDRSISDAELHTNFKLSGNGEYLGLVDADGVVIDDFAPNFPPQLSDWSYGPDASGADKFFADPTPGEANSVGTLFTADVEFEFDSGFYDDPFQLTLKTATPDAVIRYTLDGSEPSPENGDTYQGSIEVSMNTVVRAVAVSTKLEPSKIQTRSYLFLDDIVSQSVDDALAKKLPRHWTRVDADYDMDQKIVGPDDHFDGVYTDAVRRELMALPSLSLVADVDDFFGRRQGIYINPLVRGPDSERKVSGELIEPTTGSLVSFDSGIRIQGGVSRWVSSKLSLRLIFRDDYGDGQLNYPIFGEDRADTFDSITLRSNGGEMIRAGARYYIRDKYARDTQLAMGNPASNSRFVHLYLNGLYWGVYEATERPDAQFAANYFGGEKDEWDVINAGDLGAERDTAINGNLLAWNELIRLVGLIGAVENTAQERHALFMRITGKNPDGSNNLNFEQFLDVENYIDYLIMNWHISSNDWPNRNFYFARQRGPESTGFKFFPWDAESSLLNEVYQTTSEIQEFGATESLGPSRIFPGLYQSEDFRVRFADRVQLHYSPGGAMYVNEDAQQFDDENPHNNNPAARFLETAQQFRQVIVPETARWGDVRKDDSFTRDEIWEPRIRDVVSNFFPERSRQMVQILEDAELYVAAPSVGETPGVVDAGTKVSIQSDQPLVYYTLDGSDPRNPDGTINPTAILYDAPIEILSSLKLVVRSIEETTWSAKSESTYLVDGIANASSLRISEVHYHPSEPTAEEIAAGYRRDDFEFIELVNTSSSQIRLDEAKLLQVSHLGRTEGVFFDFDQAMVQTLEPGQRILVVEDIDAMHHRYGFGLPIAGEWSGRLDNSDELLTLSFQDIVIQQFRFRDTWFPETDGLGASLEIIDVTTADLSVWGKAIGWRPSRMVGGSPGVPSEIPGDANRDGIFDTRDLVALFIAGEFEDDIVGNSTWETGDWNGDFEFDSSDLIMAFEFGAFVKQ